MEIFSYLLQGATGCFSATNSSSVLSGFSWNAGRRSSGLGPTAAIALLLPVSYHIPPVATIIMLCGIYYRRHVRRLDNIRFLSICR